MTMVTTSLAPGFLLASPPLGDPNFERTVVLLAVHNGDGALGFVVNRTATMQLGELLSLAGYEASPPADSPPVYVGGPVQPSSGWILSEDPSLGNVEGAIALGRGLTISSSRKAFDALAQNRVEAAPIRRMVLLGYSGWGPGQLEGEIASGSWLPVPLEPFILFDVEAEARWERAYATLGLTPAGVMSMRSIGSA